jgi:hypothetical protein
LGKAKDKKDRKTKKVMGGAINDGNPLWQFLCFWAKVGRFNEALVNNISHLMVNMVIF